MNVMLQNLLKHMLRYGLQKSDLPPPEKCLPQPPFGSTHTLLHCPILDLTSLVLDNLKQNVQASHNYSSSGNLSSGDQACHNYDSSNSLGLYGQFFHNYKILMNRCNHPDVVCYICCKAATTRNSVEPVYFLRTVTPNLPLSFTSHFNEQPTNEMLLMFKNIIPKLQCSILFFLKHCL